MTRPSAQFLHAAGLRLDVPVDDASRFLSGSETPLRDLLASSAFQALERLVSAAIELDVDFVLLGGDTFRDVDHSVAARAALRRAFEELGEHSIPVFVVPGREDPAGAWTAFPSLPAHVTLLTPDPADDGPHLLERSDEVVVAVEYRQQSPYARRQSAGGAAAAWRVAVLADSPWTDEGEGIRPDDVNADYLAVAAVTERRTAKNGAVTVHAPGCATLTEFADEGIGAATLVTLDERGINCEPVPLSSFGRLRAVLNVETLVTEERLVQEMRRALHTLEASKHLGAALVEWTVRGRGPLRAALRDAEYWQLVSETAAEGWGRPAVTLHQTFRLEPSIPDAESVLAGHGRSLTSKALAHLDAESDRFAPEEWLAPLHTPDFRRNTVPARESVLATAAAFLDEWFDSSHETTTLD